MIARNPEPDTSLPYLLRIPTPGEPIVLKARETWPRTSKVYCHRAPGWPAAPEVVERVPVRRCVKRGAAIELVLDRKRESRSQFVLTHVRGGREAIFWQTARTTKQARPRAALPRARSGGMQDVEIVVDSHERYAWKFSEQQAHTVTAALAVGDYAVRDGEAVIAVVERKSLADLTSSLTSGKLTYAMAELDGVGHAAVVVEERYSKVFSLDRVRPAVMADGLGELAVRFPAVPIVFCETQALAQEWTYRFLAAALRSAHDADAALARFSELEAAAPLPPKPIEPPAHATEPTTAMVRAWARSAGLDVPVGGRLRPEIWDAYRAEHDGR